jgi:preprotein translocase subunit SecB
MSENAIIANPFKLISTRAVEVILNSKDSPFNNDYILDFNHKIFKLENPQNEIEKRIFVVEFDARIHNTPQSLLLSTKFHVIFQSELPVTDEYLDSPGIRINSPAIAFPFLRSFITTVSANAGYPPIILPSINFVRLSSKEIEQKSS